MASNKIRIKKQLLTAAALTTSVLFFSCKNTGSEQNSLTGSDSGTVTYTKKNAPTVNISLTDSSGQVLKLTFDNSKNTVTAVLNNETIEMVQDTTASGISASNDRYKYTEWHGEVKLEKDGKVIFDKK